MDERPWVIATRVTLAIVALILGVLVVTGVMLVFGYRPNVTAAFAAVQGIPSHSQTRTVHRVASQALFPAFGCLAIAATGLALVRHRAWRLVAVVAAGFGVVTASFTGFLLPWDQLALTRVTVGTNITGYGKILFGNDVKYVLLGRNEVGPSTLARWFWVHVLAASLLIVVSLVIVALHTRTDRRDRSHSPASSPDEAPRTP
jgi:quinol---cytochrome c reductase cytochrome b subunit, bacillus type